MIELVQRCLDRDDEAWGDLFLLGERVGLPGIRHVLRKYRLAEMEFDVLQEIYLRLLNDDMRYLRTFRGTTNEQFEIWFCRVAWNASSDWAQRELATIKRQESRTPFPDVVETRGPTLDQLSGLLDELAAMLTCRPDHLRNVIGLDPAHTVSLRTIRRWQHRANRHWRGS